ncbi:unnamed protein product [Durusdinium trenchii]|uniref:Uncharacterized protein n=1 Tax=Durusdinium trenchii TaxID=1381693 RepID=A0ABP0LAB8_9DINO
MVLRMVLRMAGTALFMARGMGPCKRHQAHPRPFDLKQLHRRNLVQGEREVLKLTRATPKVSAEG